MYSPRVMPRLTQEQLIENSLREEEAFVLEGMRRNDELEGLRKLAEKDYRREQALRIWKGAACGLAIVAAVAFAIWLIVRVWR